MGRNLRIIIITALIFILLFSSFSSLAQEKRLDIILVRSDIPVDWIVANAYAKKTKIPILTVGWGYLSEEEQRLLLGYKQFGWTKVLVIGGPTAVSESIVNNLREFGFEVQRIWGLTRYATAANVAAELWQSPTTVVITNGERMDMALAAARIAGELGAPILLTKKDDLTDDTRHALFDYLKPKEVIVVGPVSEIIQKELSQIKTVTYIGTNIQGPQTLEQIRSAKSQIWDDPKVAAVLGLISGLTVAVLIAFSISFIRMRRLKAKESLPVALLTEEERKVVDEIIKAGGILKQEDLPELTGFSRPKISRLISDLEGRGILIREKDGKSYKVSFEKRFKT